MAKGTILIVDDNTELLIALRMLLGSRFDVDTLEHPRTLLHQIENNAYDLVLLDMNFGSDTSGNEGLYWMSRIFETKPALSVVLITAYGEVERAVQGIKGGAIDFILKSWDSEKILSTLLAAYKLHQAKAEMQKLQDKQTHLMQEIDKSKAFYRGISPAMQQVYKMVEKVAPTEANILLLGENGTGKEVIAREIHRRSGRKNDILVAVDMGSIAETLFESELFGYKKGAFTDAKANKAGQFEVASGGTLFLDEIGNLSPAVQQKLLSAIQNRRITPLGSVVPVEIDVRLICATNADIIRMTDTGLFRKDLFYRINTVIIALPPLRQCKEDIPGLLVFFLQKYNAKYGKNVQFSPDEIAQLCRHDWQGNIRELKHYVELAVIMAEDGSRHFITPVKQNNHLAANTFNLEENEKKIIRAALDCTKGNISNAAGELGISRSTLYEKIQKYGL